MHPNPTLRSALRFFVLVLALGLTAGGVADALAQLRPIPPKAKRGELRHLQGMVVELDGAAVPLAAGAQIRDPDNRIVLPGALPGRVTVRYLLDAKNRVSSVWILSPQEAARPDPGN